MDKKTLLIVDDTSSNLDILMELLDEYDVLATTNGIEALDILEKENVDLVLLDIMMPEMDGFEVSEKIKQNDKIKCTPIIFLTSKTDEESIEKAYDIGGSDYITKPFKPKELLARVKKELQLQDLQKDLQTLISTDSLTKLFNKKHFSIISKQVLSLAKREKENISLIIFEIDKLKDISDTYGHDISDEILISFSNILRSFQRKNDYIFRFSGEQFIILLPHANIKKAQMIAQNVREEIGKSTIIADKNINISAGISNIKLNETDTAPVFKRANSALLKAKDDGGNRVCIVEN